MGFPKRHFTLHSAWSSSYNDIIAGCLLSQFRQVALQQRPKMDALTQMTDVGGFLVELIFFLRTPRSFEFGE